jgi:hypothetical protein
MRESSVTSDGISIISRTTSNSNIISRTTSNNTSTSISPENGTSIGTSTAATITPASSESPDVTIAKLDEEPGDDSETDHHHMSIKQESPTYGSSSSLLPPPPLSSLKPSVQDIVAHLESIVRDFMDTVNHRQLHMHHPILAYFDSRFSTTSPPPWPPVEEDLQTYIGRLMMITMSNPDYRMENMLLDTHVYKNGHAGVFVTFQVSGVPPGVTRLTVAIFRFRKRDGKWRCFTVEEVIHGGGGVMH